jgi:hypothetical protein
MRGACSPWPLDLSRVGERVPGSRRSASRTGKMTPNWVCFPRVHVPLKARRQRGLGLLVSMTWMAGMYRCEVHLGTSARCRAVKCLQFAKREAKRWLNLVKSGGQIRAKNRKPLEMRARSMQGKPPQEVSASGFRRYVYADPIANMRPWPSATPAR